jgi:hypothetical protein
MRPPEKLVKSGFFKKSILWFICFLTIIFSQSVIYAQEVEHNYKVGPNYIDCDSIKIIDLSERDAISTIRAGIYRFHQNFRLTRKQGFQRGEFYSCNTIQGYMIIKYDDTEFLYVDVDKQVWNELIGSQDPEGYYLKIMDQLQKFSD